MNRWHLILCVCCVSAVGQLCRAGEGPVVVTPEQFGAQGDGRSDDTTAFQQAAAAIQKTGDGVLVLRPKAVYRVGRQTHAEGQTPYWQAEPVLRLEGIRSFRLLGFGATLHLNDGLHYGAFDGRTGASLPTKVSAEKMFTDCPKSVGLAVVEIAHAYGRVLQLNDRCDQERIAGCAGHLLGRALAGLGRGLPRKHVPRQGHIQRPAKGKLIRRRPSRQRWRGVDWDPPVCSGERGCRRKVARQRRPSVSPLRMLQAPCSCYSELTEHIQLWNCVGRRSVEPDPLLSKGKPCSTRRVFENYWLLVI